MDKALFDKYIREMKQMQASATPAAANTTAPRENENNANMEGGGGLIVMVTAVRGLYPVENAKVTVFTGSGNNAKIINESTTDRSGRTPLIKLSAPSSELSEAPNPNERPYAYYNIKTSADGYIDTSNYNLAVFDDTVSVQNVTLYPLTTSPEGNKPIVIDEYENYEL